MANRVKTYEEAEALLAEYRALPDDLTDRLNWGGYARLPILTIACVCGYRLEVQLDLGDVERAVRLGPEKFQLIYQHGLCWGHDGGDDTDDIEEEETDEEKGGHDDN